VRKSLITARWGAELNTDVCDPYSNADLTITLKLGFRQINPAAGAREGTYHDFNDAKRPARKIIKWGALEWENWAKGLTASAQRYWNGKFWLINNFPILEFEEGSERYRPNIYCRIRIVPVLHEGGLGSAHHVIAAVRLHPTEF
jgi:hypothetical protein